jgi:hypothetical protein
MSTPTDQTTDPYQHTINPRYVAVTPRPRTRRPDQTPAPEPPPSARAPLAPPPDPAPSTTRQRRAARRMRRAAAAAPSQPQAGLLATATHEVLCFTGRHTWRAVRFGLRQTAAHPAEFAPPAAAGAVFAAGEFEQQLPLGYGLVLTVLVVAGYLLVAKARSARARATVQGRLRRAYRILCTSAAAVWLILAAATAPTSPWTLRLFLGATASATLAWWARHAPGLRRPAVPDPADDVDAAAALNAAFTGWWQERFGQGAGALSGSYLVDPNCDEIADRATIQLDDRHDTTASALRCKTMIAAARRTAATNVVIEPPMDGREDQALIAIYKPNRNPLFKPIPFTGPEIDYRTGRFKVATHADGTSAFVRFWRPGSGTLHEMVCGASDAGKSRYVDLALALERHCLDPETGEHLVVSWIADPQQGQSLPDWQGRVDRFETSIEGAMAMLEDVDAEMKRRNTYMGSMKWTDGKGRERTGKASFEPTPELPILSVTIEESPEILKIPRAVEIIAGGLKLARKTGIRWRLILQIPSITELGNSFVIRPLLASMNVVCLRTAGSITDNVFNLPGDPAKLPAFWPDKSSTAGLCYIGGGDARPATARVLYLEDVYEWAHSGSTAHFPYEPARAEVKPDPAAEAVDGPESDDGASARIRIIRYLVQLKKPATSRMICEALNLRPSTVSNATKRAKKAGHLVGGSGVWAAPGVDVSAWSKDALAKTSAA